MEERLQEVKDIHIYAKGQEKAGVISFTINGLHPFDVGTLLDQQGIAVRTGHHCAEPLIDWLGVPGTIRASLALYNNKEDIDRLIKALQVAVGMLR